MTAQPAGREAAVSETAVAGLVSVIIPNYNHAAYLGDAIDSALRQTYPHFEVIVVDDGSTDDSRAVAARYGDRIRTIWQENQGLSAARNTGLRHARGEYVALLDADDMLEPTFMQALTGVLAADPDLGGVICGYQFVDDDGVPLPQQEARSIAPQALHDTLLDGNFLVPESILVRRRCYQAVAPFDETLRACEDWDMWLRMSQQFAIGSLPRLLTRHRVLRGSMSSDPQRMLDNRLVVLARLLGPEPADARSGTARTRRAFARAYLVSATEYLQHHDRTQAYACFARAVQLTPGILTELDTFYELGLGDQPKGRRGHFGSIDLTWSTQAVFEMLDRLYAQAPPAVDRAASYATAHHALGLLSYGARALPAARAHLLRVIRHRPGAVLQR
ncbi:MAG: glycosyltransferase, partial [Anaerolineales bacterium]|nr:glycosyltransferase [Anaerolineales bacterium]